ncbi:PHP domain-containing protein [Candidatus Woesearchaeota archaeon]|nr:PHP domain-containing protein [Candidatus Woesearchaeota archaeon]
MTTVLFQDPSEVHALKDMTLLDMHSHTTFSDGRDPLSICLQEAKRKKVHLCVTDHNTIQGSLLACKQGFSFPSIEVTSNETMDALFYFSKPNDLEQFYTKYIHRKEVKQYGLMIKWYRLSSPMVELLEYASQFNAFCVLAHPTTFPPKESATFVDEHRTLLKRIDAIEGINSMIGTYRNKQAQHYAALWEKPMVGGSDAHIAPSIGSVVTACTSEKRDAILEQLRKGDNLVVGKPLSFFHKCTAAYTLVRRNLHWHGL